MSVGAVCCLGICSTEWSKRMLELLANAVTGTRCPCCPQRGCQPLPHLIPTALTSCSCCTLLCLGAAGGRGSLPLGIKRMWSWMWCAGCGGICTPGCLTRSLKGLRRGVPQKPLFVRNVGGRKTWHIFWHPEHDESGRWGALRLEMAWCWRRVACPLLQQAKQKRGKKAQT